MRALTALLSAATLLALPAFAQRAPNPTEQSAAISAIREYAVNYTQRLPDYACTQVTQWRGQPFQVLLLGSPRSGEVETQIGFVNHREMEKVTAINGKPAALAEPKDLPPTSAHGEFGSLLAMIFDPQTPTEFHWSGGLRGAGGACMCFPIACRN